MYIFYIWIIASVFAWIVLFYFVVLFLFYLYCIVIVLVAVYFCELYSRAESVLLIDSRFYELWNLSI